ncbi:ribosomal protein L6 [Spizellomyces punctatus DAOM BR117]|uniref:Ribosomal protein L6 n=1 Tax=Spizellomyces punctatus (strain DAOM BR117) TaxID=645134 RepID=A0A0L0HPB9_SPIPD|nr:ribosomal protein L6 [Spizellomyces punctatus DAOM BR117]KND03251.1 ribosomal protein L6 [Spizellomyces punctatus DAOM BR117]|eukprot:XP_016611290.1 ribosomal protein L6 [Spizellomyces punctatus DAOM BR117]
MWVQRLVRAEGTSFSHYACRSFTTTGVSQSMIGRRVLKYPHEVAITTEPYLPTPSFPRATTQVTVKGPRGSLSMPLQPFVAVQIDAHDPTAPKRTLSVSVTDPKDRKQRAMWGTTRALLENMVEGVHEGFTVPIRFNGVGYRALFEEGKLSLKLGYSHPILLDIPEGVDVKIPAPTRIILQGNDLQKITQFAASIRKWRPPEPYNQKGIFIGDETIKKKEGKKR